MSTNLSIKTDPHAQLSYVRNLIGLRKDQLERLYKEEQALVNRIADEHQA